MLEAVFDALGDFDLAFAGKQLDRAHFAHVHADRVGGAAEFGVDGRQGLFGLFFGVVVARRGDAIGHQQIFGRRGLVKDADAHVAEGGNDRFDLLGIDEVVRQVIVDLGIGQVSPLLAQRDQRFELGATHFCIERGRRRGGCEYLTDGVFLGARLGGATACRALAWRLGVFLGHDAPRKLRRSRKNRKLYYESETLGCRVGFRFFCCSS